MSKNKKILVIGAGFSGLSAAIRLQQTLKCSVQIFDGSKPYEKASKIASGIIHPFPGQHARPAKFFKEAIQLAFDLFEEAKLFADQPFINHCGIYRICTQETNLNQFQHLIQTYPFVHPFSLDRYPLKSGNKGLKIDLAKTVFAEHYLKALEKFFLAIGGKIDSIQLDSLKEVSKEYDHIVVAAGKNSSQLLNGEYTKFHKGQLLVGKFKNQVDLDLSITGKGYLALTETKGVFVLGSTYEHYFKEESPTEIGKQLILKDAATYLQSEEFETIEIKSAFRTTKKINGIPLCLKLNDKLSTVTAMGSRGLLYHAFCAKVITEAIFNQSEIPDDLKVY